MRTNGVLGQLIRFGISGGISTVVYAAVYLPLADHVLAPGWAVLAVPPAFLAAVTIGFFLHSAWSFKGHGTRENSGKQHAKFVLVQLFGMVLNAAFTGAMTGLMHLPNWAPLIPAVTVIPLATFTINRQWVFG
jgi:putative flippase GtrA